jgi:hypothetical protein
LPIAVQGLLRNTKRDFPPPPAAAAAADSLSLTSYLKMARRLIRDQTRTKRCKGRKRVKACSQRKYLFYILDIRLRHFNCFVFCFCATNITAKSIMKGSFVVFKTLFYGANVVKEIEYLTFLLFNMRQGKL